MENLSPEDVGLPMDFKCIIWLVYARYAIVYVIGQIRYRLRPIATVRLILLSAPKTLGNRMATCMSAVDADFACGLL